MSADVLKEFVVALGWKVDQGGEKKFKETVRSATLQAELLSKALEQAAKVVVQYVAQLSKSFDELYYVSQRTGASAQNVKALAYAFGQVGSSSASAVQALDAYSKAVRTNPGVGSFVRSLGVKQTGDAFKDLSASIDAIQKKNPYYSGAQLASLLGLSEEQYYTFTQQRDGIAKRLEEYNRITKMVGLNNEDAAKAGHSFSQSLATIGAIVGALGQKLLIQLAPAMERVVKAVLSWIEANPERIERFLTSLGEVIDKLLASLASGAAAKKLDEIAEAISSIASAIGKLETVLGASKWIGKLFDFNMGGGLLGNVIRGSYENPGSIGGGSGGGASASPGSVGGLREMWRKRPSWLGGSGGGDNSGPPGGSGRPGKAQRNENTAAIIGELRKAGYNDNAIAAIVGSMQTESSFNPKARNEISGGHTGLWQWDRNRWPKIKKWITDQGGDPYDARWQTKAWVAEHDAKPGDAMYDHRRTENGGRILRNNPSLPDAIHGVRESERFGAGEEGNRGNNARAWLPHVKAPTPAPPTSFPNPGFSPGGFDVNKATSGAPLGASTTNNSTANTVTMNHQTTIKIDGASDPATTGSFVERGVNRSSALSLRNAQTAMG